MTVETNDQEKCELALKGLYFVDDPEIGLNVVDLGLIYQIEFIEEEEKIFEKTDTVENPAEISFHGTEEFFADIKIAPKYSEPISYKAPEPQPNKHEIEMQRLIAEVEAKMKASKKTKHCLKQKKTFQKSQRLIFLKHKPSILPKPKIVMRKRLSSKKRQQQKSLKNKIL